MTGKISVLVVEDEPFTRFDIADHLEQRGFEVFQAADADAAIKLLETNASIRVMFTDIDMPGSMDGLKLASAVRNRWPPVQIVIASGLRNIDMDAPLSEVQFFAKPYDVSLVAAVMQDLVGVKPGV